MEQPTPAHMADNAAQNAAPSRKKRVSLLQIALLQLCVLLFSGASVLQKLAWNHPLPSWPFVLLLGGSLGILFLYALAWQQFLKRIPLSTAYANRAMAMLWSMLFGALLFSETIRWNMVAGVVVIAAGILIVVTADE